jgi:hypothetical protein
MGVETLSEHAAALVTTALREVYVKEATGRNDGVPSLRYQKDPYRDGIYRSVPWCAYFVMWVFDQVDGPKLHHSRRQWWEQGSVKTLYENWAGCEVDEPEPGDLIVINKRGASDPSPTGWHIGLVVAVTEDKVLSVDGNWGNMVDTVVRHLYAPEIVAFLRIR